MFERLARAVEQPARHVALQVPDAGQRVDLGDSRAPCRSSASMPRPQLARVQHFAGDGVGLGDLRRRLAGVFLHAQQEGRAHAVDDRVGDRGGDDLAAQAVLLHVLGVASPAAASGSSAPVPSTGTGLPARPNRATAGRARSWRSDSSTDSSGRVRPWPRALRSSSSASVGRNSMARSSRPCASSVRMKCCLEPRRDTLMRSIRLIAWFWR